VLTWRLVAGAATKSSHAARALLTRGLRTALRGGGEYQLRCSRWLAMAAAVRAFLAASFDVCCSWLRSWLSFELQWFA
jgi:hypothetical protein